jgi:predicted phage terminase large subunit-like protein
MLLEQLQTKILQDQNFRKELARSSYYWFNHIYFPEYITYPTAPFQKEIYQLLENWQIKFLEVIAFRGSAKSTLAMFGLPIWAVITGKARFPVLFSSTFLQTKLHIYNLKTELEYNSLLVNDFGPFMGQEEWTATEIVLPNYSARIVAKSRGQKIRGIRHKEIRPDLIIIDDIEDSEDVRTKEERDKTYNWFNTEIVPAGDRNTRYIIIGNLLHKDSFMSRIKKILDDKVRDGVCKMFPFFDENGKPIWEEKFSNQYLVEEEKKKYDNRTWQREFLLKIVPEEGQEVKDEWIRYYDKIPEEKVSSQGVGVDLAISEKEGADYTAMVSGKLVTTNEGPKIYILPYPVNERLTFSETIQTAKTVSNVLGLGTYASLWVEDVAYQKAAIQEMQREGLPAKGVSSTTDKRARLRTVATYIENGTVLFPKRGCEDLINQLTGFGVEAHDDLVDAFVLLVQGLISGFSGFYGYMKQMKEEEKKSMGLQDWYEMYRKQIGEF